MENTIDGFADLGLADNLRKAVAKAGYLEPTPIQRAAIPLVLRGSDVLGCAQTGTGKTAAFALPILQRLASATRPRAAKAVISALVLAPTRELASQIGDELHRLTARNRPAARGDLRRRGQGAQIQALRRGVDILVATPGRLLDLMQQRESI